MEATVGIWSKYRVLLFSGHFKNRALQRLDLNCKEVLMTFQKFCLITLSSSLLFVYGCSSSDTNSKEDQMLNIDEYNSAWAASEEESPSVENWSFKGFKTIAAPILLGSSGICMIMSRFDLLKMSEWHLLSFDGIEISYWKETENSGSSTFADAPHLYGKGG